MYPSFTTVVASALALTTCIQASPVAIPDANVERRGEKCKLSASFHMHMSLFSSGRMTPPPPQPPNYIWLERPGQKLKKVSNKPRKAGKQTISAKTAGTAKDIVWNGKSTLGGWDGCSVEYDGKTFQGKTRGKKQMCRGPGDTCSECTVEFDC
ncbi:hypothetical protein K461DRAFT_296544 [Myriangium duriaei CBS 260.36]|uniref:Uncharacterized protein n=1 Tax=Myriangium duriaei CBS 260.36 TaxID=1168546 RepID=A0A9P4J0J4_9PEZI|nr:hypothetical protein K461DRAFT_296544 [Myriangium duriaei CBS 260.36]